MGGSLERSVIQADLHALSCADNNCTWVYDPFTKGYSDIRGFLLPGFMVATQFFFTLCFLLCLLSFGLILLFVLCCLPEQQRYVQLISMIGFILAAAGVCGVIGVIVFACFGNADGWMPGHTNNFFGYSFGLGVCGSVLSLIASLLFLVEANVQRKKRQYLKESQSRFQLSQS
ncbi:uncharacterized protein sinu isoform X2 [Venturia canescens]|uniref:uncharacterized protein sinu isoform X2 n=1 Tax=Venturia canescens TaxID=32260 RepID=UPI001C9C7706|nr:uncharacterized protein LOC122415647 isoform X2 [Venturia canescens]